MASLATMIARSKAGLTWTPIMKSGDPGKLKAFLNMEGTTINGPVHAFGATYPSPLHLFLLAYNTVWEPQPEFDVFLEMLEVLLHKGANPSAVDGLYGSPLLLATNYPRIQSARLIELLVQYDADVDVGNIPPLFNACARGNVEAVELLLKAGADPNRSIAYDRYPGTPLSAALFDERSQNPLIVRLLLEYGATIPLGLAMRMTVPAPLREILMHPPPAKPRELILAAARNKKGFVSRKNAMKFYKYGPYEGGARRKSVKRHRKRKSQSRRR